MAKRLTATIRGIAPTALQWEPKNLAPNDGATLNSSYTERSPRPGTQTSPNSRARGVPEVSNAQSEDLEFEFTSAGLPGPRGAALTYKKDSETSDSRRGWDPPNLLTHWLAQEWTDSLTYGSADLAVIPSTQRVLGVAGSDCRRLDPESMTWSAAVNVAVTLSLTSVTSIAVIPGSERVLVFEVPSTVGQDLSVGFSDDAGASFGIYSLRAVRNPSDPENGVGVAPTRRAKSVILDDDSVLLLAEQDDASGDVGQAASSDLGTTFAHVEVASAFGKNIEVDKLADGTIIVGYIGDATSRPTVAFLGSPFDALSSAETVEVGGITIETMSMTVDADGSVYVFAVQNSDPSNVLVWVSTDQGRTWSQFDYGILETGDVASFVKLQGAVSAGGYTFLSHNWSASPGNEDDSIGTMVLGGWQNLTTAPDTSDAALWERTSYGHHSTDTSNTWIPIVLPQDTIYTLTGTSGTLVSPGELDITTAAAQSKNTFNHSTSLASLTHYGQLRVDSGGSLSSLEVGWAVEIGDNVEKYKFEIRFDTTGFRVEDIHGATTLVTVAISMTTALQVRTELGSAGTLRVYYRRPGDTIWARVAVSAYNLVDGGAGAPNDVTDWGHVVSTTSSSGWQMFLWSEAPFGSFGAQTIGRSIADLPYPLLEVGDATTLDKAFVSLKSGPAVRGEVYDVQVEHDHGVERLFPSISPSRDDTFETTGTALTRVSVDLVDESRLGNSWTLLLAVMGANMRKVKLLADRGTASFSTVGTLDLATGFTGLTYELVGNLLRPGAATPVGARWIQAMEAVGGHIIVETGGGTGTGARRIVSHSAGEYRTPSSADPFVFPEFRLEGIDGSEDATGSCDIVWPSGVLVVHLTGDASGAGKSPSQHLAIEIEAGQDTVEGRYKLGVAGLGALVVPGKQWSNGWAYEVRPNTRARRDPYGTEYREQRGPEVRTLTIGVADGVKSQFIREGTEVDFIGSSVGAPLAGRDDVLAQFIGLLRESEGFSRPAVVLSKVPDASDVTITDPSLYIWGHVTGTVRANHVTGDEDEREFYRIEQLQIVEVR